MSTIPQDLSYTTTTTMTPGLMRSGSSSSSSGGGSIITSPTDDAALDFTVPATTSASPTYPLTCYNPVSLSSCPSAPTDATVAAAAAAAAALNDKSQFPSATEFDRIVNDYLRNLSSKKRDKALVDHKRYQLILCVLKDPRNTSISTAQFRFWVKKMFQLVDKDVVYHDNKPVAMREQIYSILVTAHRQAHHGGRDKTSALVRKRYSWIPKELIARFVRHCPFCITRRNGCGSPPTVDFSTPDTPLDDIKEEPQSQMQQHLDYTHLAQEQQQQQQQPTSWWYQQPDMFQVSSHDNQALGNGSSSCFQWPAMGRRPSNFVPSYYYSMPAHTRPDMLISSPHDPQGNACSVAAAAAAMAVSSAASSSYMLNHYRPLSPCSSLSSSSPRDEFPPCSSTPNTTTTTTMQQHHHNNYYSSTSNHTTMSPYALDLSPIDFFNPASSTQ